MFYKIIEVNTAVFKYFSERIFGELGVLTRYARKSSFDYSQEQKQQLYPCVAIQDYVPVPKEDWWIEHKPFHRATSLDGETAYLYYLPLWMQFRYDISTATKSFKEHQRIQQWFLENVVAVDEIVLQPVVVGDTDAGEPITITSRVQDVPRTDGVFETNYEVTFDVWLYARSPVGVEAIQDIVIRLNRVKPKVPIVKRLASFDPLSFDEGFAVTSYPVPRCRGDFDRGFDRDFSILSAGSHCRCVLTERLTDCLAQLMLEIDGYSGIRDILLEDYMALEEKDPNMIYVIQ